VDEPPITLHSKPVSDRDKILLEKFEADFVEQANRIADLAKQLITVELAIPGIYATALKLLQGDKATLAMGWDIRLAFGLWALSLIFSFAALFPRNYRVDRKIIRRDEDKKFDKPLSIEAYFIRSARYKLYCVGASCFCFIGGLIASLSSLF